MENKRYYWLKLQDDFFSSKRIKKLRKLAGGDTYTIIYLKMQLKSLKTNGCLEYTGIEETFAKELALDLDEDEDNVAVTVSYLLSVGLLETNDNEYKMPYVELCTGSETAAAERMRNHRKKNEPTQVCNNVTPMLQNGYVEKEIEKEKDKEIDINEEFHQLENWFNENEKKTTSKKFKAPTLEEVRDYCKARNSSVDADKFFEYYSTGNWKDAKGNQVKNWKQKILTWESKNNGNKKVYKAEEMQQVKELDVDKLSKELFGKKGDKQ